MLKFTLIGFLVFCQIAPIWACHGGGSSEEDFFVPVTSKMTNPYNKHIWYGWDAPPEAKGAWAQWMAKYQQAIAGKGGPYNPSIHDKPYGQDVKDWPADWGVLGPPRDGMMPPPWAYVPKRSGKPALCYDPPLYGDCSSNIYRYGYNSFTEECLQFSYSGCGGNMNNFVECERCRDTCMGSPKFGCNDDSKIPIDTIVGARRCGYQDDVPNDYLSVRDYPGSKWVNIPNTFFTRRS